jgi:integrase
VDLDDYGTDIAASGMAATTRYEYLRRLRQAPFELPGNSREARNWIATVPGLENRRMTLRALKSYARWHADEFGRMNDIAAIPMPKGERPKPGRIARDDDIEALMRHLDNPEYRREAALVSLFYWTGCRRSEAAHLSLQNVNMDERTITFEQTKNGDSRTVPMHPELHRALRRWLRIRSTYRLAQATQAVFIGKYGPLRPDGITQILTPHLKPFGITPHQFRRRLAMRWCAEGGSDDTLMHIAGWRSPAMPGRYRREAVAQLAQDAYHRIF